MIVLEYLKIRSMILDGKTVSDVEWNDIIKFEQDFPYLIMSPPAVTLSKQMRGDINV